MGIRNNMPANESYAAEFRASPAQMFFSRRIRTDLPTLSRHLTPTDTKLAAMKKQENAVRFIANRNLKKQELKPLAFDQKVYVMDPLTKMFNQEGQITEKLNERSYTVDIDGGLKRRNRSMLRPHPEQKAAMNKEETRGTPQTVNKTPSNTEGQSDQQLRDPESPSNDQGQVPQQQDDSETPSNTNADPDIPAKQKKEPTFYQKRDKQKRKADKAFYTENPRRSARTRSWQIS